MMSFYTAAGSIAYASASQAVSSTQSIINNTIALLNATERTSLLDVQRGFADFLLQVRAFVFCCGTSHVYSAESIYCIGDPCFNCHRLKLCHRKHYYSCLMNALTMAIVGNVFVPQHCTRSSVEIIDERHRVGSDDASVNDNNGYAC